MGRGGLPGKRNHPHETGIFLPEGSALHGNLETKQKPCKAPAVRGWNVCRFHGAGGGAPKGGANGAYKHGLFTQRAKAERRLISDLLRRCRKTIASAGDND
jgi:hypothetical protein